MISLLKGLYDTVACNSRGLDLMTQEVLSSPMFLSHAPSVSSPHFHIWKKPKPHTHTHRKKKLKKKKKKDLDDTISFFYSLCRREQSLSPVQRIHLLEVDVVLKSVNN